jgi:Transposase DDE domain
MSSGKDRRNAMVSLILAGMGKAAPPGCLDSASGGRCPAPPSRVGVLQLSERPPDRLLSSSFDPRPAELGYFNNYLIDNQSCVIVDVQATTARLSQESAAAREMITRSAERRGRFPQSVAADTTYGNGELLAWFEERNITPYIRVKESPAPKTNLYGIEKFTYVAETNSYQCPEGKRLTYLGVNPRNRNHIYWATRKRCRECAHKSQCTTGHYRQIAMHVHEAARRSGLFRSASGL